MSLPDQFVPGGLDVVDLLLPQLQLSHQTLKTTEETRVHNALHSLIPSYSNSLDSLVREVVQSRV